MREYNQVSGFGSLFSTVTAMVSPAHQVITHKPLYEHVAPLKIRPNVWSSITWIGSTLRQWNQRAIERQALMRLDDHMLDDLGIERIEAANEGKKPFWRP